MKNGSWKLFYGILDKIEHFPSFNIAIEQIPSTKIEKKGIRISTRWEGGTVGSPRGVGEWGDYDPNTLTGTIK